MYDLIAELALPTTWLCPRPKRVELLKMTMVAKTMTRR